MRRRLGGAGAHVTLAARSGDEVCAGADAIRAVGGSAVERFDILLNNAGTNRPKPFTDVSEEDYDAILGPNLRSAFFVAQAVSRRMIDAGVRGSLIHMGSQMGHVGGPRRSLYCVQMGAGGV